MHIHSMSYNMMKTSRPVLATKKTLEYKILLSLQFQYMYKFEVKQSWLFLLPHSSDNSDLFIF